MVRREMYHPRPEELEQKSSQAEKPKKMTEMNAGEFEAALLSEGSDRLDLSDFKVFAKAKEVLGETHPLVRAAHNLESRKGGNAMQIRDAVEKYRHAKQELESIKQAREADNQNDNVDLKKAA